MIGDCLGLELFQEIYRTTPRYCNWSLRALPFHSNPDWRRYKNHRLSKRYGGQVKITAYYWNAARNRRQTAARYPPASTTISVGGVNKFSQWDRWSG